MDEELIDQVNEPDDTSDDDVIEVELDDSDEFDFDENGDIVIPTDEEDEESDASEEDVAEEEEPKAEEPKAEKSKVQEPELAKPADQKKSTAPQAAYDEEKARLKAQVAEYDKLAKSALSKMGIDAKDGKSALIKLAAEAEGLSEDEYIKKQSEDAKNEEARKFMQAAKFNEKKARDLAAVHAAYPDAKKYKTERMY